MGMVITENIKKVLSPQLFLKGLSIPVKVAKMAEGPQSRFIRVPTLTDTIIQKKRNLSEHYFQVVRAAHEHYYVRRVLPESADLPGKKLRPRSGRERLKFGRALWGGSTP